MNELVVHYLGGGGERVLCGQIKMRTYERRYGLRYTRQWGDVTCEKCLARVDSLGACDQRHTFWGGFAERPASTVQISESEHPETRKDVLPMSGIGAEDLRSGIKWWGGKGCGVGDQIAGIVVSAAKEQQRDFDSGALLEWDNGEPRMESVVIIETDLRDADVDHDDGKRALHLRGGNYEVAQGTGVSGEKALLEAIQRSGLRCEAGVKITAQITGMAKITKRGANPAKLWTISMEKAAPSIGEDELYD